jgi:phytoene synthase
MAQPYRAPAESHRYVLEQVRRADRDRFLGALFAPEPQRRDLLAVLAFDHELARARMVTREPLLAAVRLQWWREAVDEAAGTGTPRAHPVVEALSETVRRLGLARTLLAELIDAREAELADGLDAMRLGWALADLELAVLGLEAADQAAASRAAARAVATARLLGAGGQRDALVEEARARRHEVDRAAWPILLPALALDPALATWRKPLAYWWAARRARY